MPGTPELLVIFLLVLVLFGPDKLPELARQIGKGIRKLRRASDDIKRQINFTDDEYIGDGKPRHCHFQGVLICSVELVCSSAARRVSIDYYAFQTRLAALLQTNFSTAIRLPLHPLKMTIARLSLSPHLPC